MNRFIFSLVFVGLAASFAFSQGDGLTRARVAATPTPAGSGQNDAVGPRSDGRPSVSGATNGGQPTSTPPVTKSSSVTGDNSDEEIKVETNLVTMPVSVLDREGRFVTGLVQRDFVIFENGARQKIEYFQSVEHPITVILMIDVSPSTSFRIEEIQNAAISFVDQLRPADRVMVMAFHESVQVLSPATNDREKLRNAIRTAKFGEGTSLYEAIDRASSRHLPRIEGRKALVIFTDGVDTTSKLANRVSTVEGIEKTDALVYPIRFDTNRGRRGGGGWTSSQRGRAGGWGGAVGIVFDRPAPPAVVGGPPSSNSGEYEVGREYLEDLARKSGGRQFEADSPKGLDAAFAGIAEELRRQYYVGYYPESVGDKGERRQIKVQVSRPGLIVRSKSSYIVGSTTESVRPGI